MTIALDQLKLVIADLDGTLVDSRLDFAKMRAAAQIPANQDILSYIDSLTSPKKEEVFSIIHQFELEGADIATPMPGTLAFCEWLEERKIPLAICTRNSKEVAMRAMQRCGLDYDFICAREDAPPKPAPDGLRLILKYFGVEPQKSIYIGDYLFDLEAAEAANIPFILFAQKGLPNYAKRAQFVMNDFNKLIDWFN